MKLDLGNKITKCPFEKGTYIAIVDKSFYIHSYHYALSLTHGAEAVGGVFGSLRMLLKLLAANKKVVIASDSSSSIKRELIPSYKHTRVPKLEIVKQKLLFDVFTTSLGLCTVECEGYEADDIIATLCKYYSEELNMNVVIYGVDKDLAALINSKVIMYNTKEKSYITEKNCEYVYSAKPKYIECLLSLAGDAADNFKGVPGIGMKSGKKLCERYGGSVKALLQDIENVQKSHKTFRTPEAIEKLRESQLLAMLDCDVDMSHLDNIKPLWQPNWEQFTALCKKYEFRSLLEFRDILV